MTLAHTRALLSIEKISYSLSYSSQDLKAKKIKEWGGVGERGNCVICRQASPSSPLPSPPLYLPFFALVPSLPSIIRAETLATHARSEQLAFTVLPTAVDFGPVKDLFPLGLSGTVRDICCSPDGRWIALGFSSGLTSVLDTRGGLLRSHRRAHTSEIYQV